MTREMKNSGVEWIGNIPSEWKIRKIKNVCSIYTGNSIKDTEKNNFTDSTNAIPYIATKEIDVSSSKINYDNGMYIKRDDENFKVAPKNSTLMCIEGGSAGKKIAYLNQDVCFVNKLCCFSTKSLDDKFLYYYLKSPSFNSEFELHISGLIGGVSQGELREFAIPVPPLPEQTRISDFLDSKVTEIDKIISETKASIENYKEYKQSVITEAVTKGLDKNVPMKDSGIEWIGEIPVDWRLGKIKSCVTKVGSGKTPKGGGDVYSSEGVLFLRSQNVYDTGLVLDDPTYISEEIDEEMKNTRVMDKDVLLNITGGSIGRCCIYDKSYGKANVNQHVSIIRLKQDIMFPEYMHYYWLSSLGKMSVNLYQTGGNREGMSADAIKNSPIIYTSISTQKEIIAFLDSKCAEIDNIILEKEKLITNLEEYKKSLIYEYVTGKKVV